MAEIQSGAAASQGARIRDITGYQWLVLFIAWAGWSLDITDFTLYGLVLRQALTELLGGNPTLAQIGSVGGLVTTVGLLGWAVGGFAFGIIADYLGRVRTLALWSACCTLSAPCSRCGRAKPGCRRSRTFCSKSRASPAMQ